MTTNDVRMWMCGLLLVASSAPCLAQTAPAAAASAASSDAGVNRGVLPGSYKGQPLLWIPKLADIEKLSPNIDEPQWKDAAVLTLQDPATRQKPKYETKVWLFCSDKALYVAVRAAEPKMDSLITTREFWQRDEIELSLEPFRDTIKRAYHYVNIDSSGATAFHRFHVYPRYFQEHALEVKWEPKAAIAAGKDANSWSFEMKIPFDQLQLDPQAVAHKTLWRMNVCRIRPDRPDEEQMLASWSNLDGRGFQAAARFGYALPEAFSSRELIDEVRRTTVLPPDPSAQRATRPEVQAEVDQAIVDLGAAGAARDADAVKKVADRIKALAKEGQAMHGLIEGKLAAAAALAKKTGQRSYGTLRDFAYTLDQVRPEDDPAPDALVQKIAAFEARQYKDSEGKALNYRLLKPKDYDPKKLYPMFIWLHGSAERGDDNLRQLYSGVWEYTTDERRTKYPCFIMAPQSPTFAGGWADMKSNPDSRAALVASSCYRLADKPGEITRLLLETIASLQKEFAAIDGQRLYIAGSSMGGFGVYECLMRRPDLFAAGMPICGGGDETKAATIAKVPIWIFHGEKDEAVKVAAARTMFKALKDAGGEPKYTEVPNAPHALGNCFMEPEVFAWLFSQKRKD